MFEEITKYICIYTTSDFFPLIMSYDPKSFCNLKLNYNLCRILLLAKIILLLSLFKTKGDLKEIENFAVLIFMDRVCIFCGKKSVVLRNSLVIAEYASVLKQ